METKLRCSRVVVFGGGSGIGKAIARQLLREGASVVICGRTPEKLDKTLVEFNSEKAFALAWDIAEVDVFDTKIHEVEKVIGEPDGFVNAAALGTAAYTGRDYEPWDITSDEWDVLNNINFKGAFFLMRNEINYMRERKIHGNILNIASNAAMMGVIGSYGASKSAIVKWTHTLGLRYGREGIMMHCISPGATLTDMVSRYAKSPDQPYERHAIGRFIKPEETAQLAAFLMSELGEIVTSHNFIADGGDQCSYE